MQSKGPSVSWFTKFGGLLLVLLASFRPSAVSAQGYNPYNFQNVVIGGGGGFIPGIVFSTTQPGLWYARTDIGGAYRFDQGSGRRIPLLDWIGFPDWNLSGVESIAIDPVDPERVYLAVGTYPTSGRAKMARFSVQRTKAKRSRGLICRPSILRPL